MIPQFYASSIGTYSVFLFVASDLTTNKAGSARQRLESLALTRNAIFPRRSKKLKEKDNSIFQTLPVILRGIEGLCGDLLYIAKSLKKYCCQELYSQLRNKQLTVCRETPSL